LKEQDMADSWDDIIAGAVASTNEELKADIAKKTRLTTEDIGRIARTKEDKAALAALLAVVQDSTRTNEQKARAIGRATDLLKMAVKVVGEVV
jgi:hypothetical protein